MNLLPSASTVKMVLWTLAALAVANRVPQARRLIQG